MDLQEILKQPLLFRRKVFKLFGNQVKVFDSQDNLVLFIKQKAFKLKEDIRVYADAEQNQEILLIKARQILDFKAAYDVIDAKTQEKVGALRRKGFSSLIRDKWKILDTNDIVIGDIIEDSTVLALIRRFVSNLIPQTHVFSVQGSKVAILKQRFNPFMLKSDFSITAQDMIDARLALAGAVLLMTIEGREGSGQ